MESNNEGERRGPTSRRAAARHDLPAVTVVFHPLGAAARPSRLVVSRARIIAFVFCFFCCTLFPLLSRTQSCFISPVRSHYRPRASEREARCTYVSHGRTHTFWTSCLEHSLVAKLYTKDGHVNDAARPACRGVVCMCSRTRRIVFQAALTTMSLLLRFLPHSCPVSLC